MSAPASPPSSPCISVCALEPASGLCLGCGRTLNEIVAWGGMAEGERLAVMAGLPARLADLPTPLPAALPASAELS